MPANGCYHSAFTPNYSQGGAYGHDDFESLAQKKIAIEMFYFGWPANRTPDFPRAQCDVIVQKGAIPHLTWEPWVNGTAYPLDGIIWGTSQTWSGWVSFYGTFKDIYNKFKSSTKPLMIGEFASTELGGDKGKWIRDAYLFNKLLFPRSHTQKLLYIK